MSCFLPDGKKRPVLDVDSNNLIYLWNVPNRLPFGDLKRNILQKYGQVRFVETFEAWQGKKIGQIVVEYQSSTGLNNFVEALSKKEILNVDPPIEFRRIDSAIGKESFFSYIKEWSGVDLLQCRGIPPRFDWREKASSTANPSVRSRVPVNNTDTSHGPANNPPPRPFDRGGFRPNAVNTGEASDAGAGVRDGQRERRPRPLPITSPDKTRRLLPITSDNPPKKSGVDENVHQGAQQNGGARHFGRGLRQSENFTGYLFTRGRRPLPIVPPSQDTITEATNVRTLFNVGGFGRGRGRGGFGRSLDTKLEAASGVFGRGNKPFAPPDCSDGDSGEFSQDNSTGTAGTNGVRGPFSRGGSLEAYQPPADSCESEGHQQRQSAANEPDEEHSLPVTAPLKEKNNTVAESSVEAQTDLLNFSTPEKKAQPPEVKEEPEIDEAFMETNKANDRAESNSSTSSSSVSPALANQSQQEVRIKQTSQFNKYRDPRCARSDSLSSLDQEKRTIIISNLKPGFCLERLVEMLQNFGDVTDWTDLDETTAKFVFVECSDAEMCVLSMRNLHDQNLMGTNPRFELVP